MEKKKKGFATMSPERVKEIASNGGKKVSQNREHMAAIGSVGGINVSKNKEHMAEIGRKGGAAARGKK